MRSTPLPAVTWGGGHVPSKTPADARRRGGEQASATPDPPAQDAPAAAPSMPDQLNQLAALPEQGALTDDEFATAKARLLGT